MNVGFEATDITPTREAAKKVVDASKDDLDSLFDPDHGVKTNPKGGPGVEKVGGKPLDKEGDADT